MQDREKEQLLHKIVASSAFLFALCILPVAQYLLVDAQTTGTSESGTVAGVSTDNTVTQANVPSLDCQEAKAKDLADLQRLEDGNKAAYLKSYDEATAGYQATLAQLNADPNAKPEEKEAVNKLIDAEYQPYLTKLNQLVSAVESQKNSVRELSCPAE